MPTAMGQVLLALDFYLGPTYELVLLNPTPDVLGLVRKRFLPRQVLASRPEDERYRSGHLAGLFSGKETTDDQPILYACRDFTCEAPAVGAQAISAKLDTLV
jgi:uncharacterized protein YyaL (SSP411 family)